MNDKCEAIAWLSNIKEKYIHGGDEEFDECRRESIDMAIKALRQPQIVRCKDCKHVCLCDTTKLMPGISIYAACILTGKAHDPEWFCADGEAEQ